MMTAVRRDELYSSYVGPFLCGYIVLKDYFFFFKIVRIIQLKHLQRGRKGVKWYMETSKTTIQSRLGGTFETLIT